MPTMKTALKAASRPALEAGTALKAVVLVLKSALEAAPTALLWRQGLL